MAKDNVIRRFKVQLITHIFNYINSLFNINNYGKNQKSKSMLLKNQIQYILKQYQKRKILNGLIQN